MRIHIRRHMIHLRRPFNQGRTWKRMKSFGGKPASSKKERFLKRMSLTASSKKNPLSGFTPGANKKNLSYRPASVTEYRPHTVLLRFEQAQQSLLAVIRPSKYAEQTFSFLSCSSLCTRADQYCAPGLAETHVATLMHMKQTSHLCSSKFLPSLAGAYSCPKISRHLIQVRFLYSPQPASPPPEKDHFRVKSWLCVN